MTPLEEEEVTTAPADNTSSNSNSNSLSLKREGSSFGGWLQRVRRTGEFSDISIQINNTTIFNLHTLPLRNGSSFFKNLILHQQNNDDPPLVQVQLHAGPDAFSISADFCYLIKPIFTIDNVASVRSVAQQLGMIELLDSTKKFLYSNVFSHWKSSAAFLHRYSRFSDASVDDYIESRCLKVIASACTKAFADTKHVSVPLPRCPLTTSAAAAVSASIASSAGVCWPKSSSSPCSSLTEVLVTVTSRLPDLYMETLVETLLEAEVNLSLKCRQGRNVRAWLKHLIRDECSTDRSRCWVLICLSEMLLRSSSPMPKLELSSQYWCSLLEHVEEQVRKRGAVKSEQMMGAKIADLGPHHNPALGDRLAAIQSQLEQRIGARLHELDDYLHSYRFSAATLLSLVQHFVRNRECDGSNKNSQEQLEEVATEVDGCLWAFAEAPASITPHQFVSIFSAFPEQCRSSHDGLYASIDRMLSKERVSSAADRKQQRFSGDEIQSLWGLVDCDKLSPGVHEQALNNPSFLCQPHVLERVLRIHNEELSAMGDEEDRKNMRKIMHKVIKASLKLLEENSRRSKEITELQNQYITLLGDTAEQTRRTTSATITNVSSCKDRPDDAMLQNSVVHPEAAADDDEDEEDDDDEDDEDEEEDDEDEDEDDSYDEEFQRGVYQEKKKTMKKIGEEDEQIVGGIDAPQTPMVEARRSLHCMTVGEILAT